MPTNSCSDLVSRTSANCTFLQKVFVYCCISWYDYIATSLMCTVLIQLISNRITINVYCGIYFGARFQYLHYKMHHDMNKTAEMKIVMQWT
jgi:hypothetical protein